MSKEIGWKVYNWSIIGGVKVVARNREEAENFAEFAASGAWDLELDDETPIEEAGISSNSHSSVKNGGGGVDFDNFHKLTPQAQRVVQELIDKLLEV